MSLEHSKISDDPRFGPDRLGFPLAFIDEKEKKVAEALQDPNFTPTQEVLRDLTGLMARELILKLMDYEYGINLLDSEDARIQHAAFIDIGNNGSVVVRAEDGKVPGSVDRVFIEIQSVGDNKDIAEMANPFNVVHKRIRMLEIGLTPENFGTVRVPKTFTRHNKDGFKEYVFESQSFSSIPILYDPQYSQVDLLPNLHNLSQAVMGDAITSISPAV